MDHPLAESCHCQDHHLFWHSRHRLQPNVSDAVAAQYMLSIIRTSFLNFRTRAYDMLQYHQNEIPY